jgi:hypothetical protein
MNKNDFVYCVSGCWYGGKAARRFHRCKIYYPANGKDSAFFRVHGYKIPLDASRDKAMFAEKFDIVEISKNKTYWFFGARFAREVE